MLSKSRTIKAFLCLLMALCLASNTALGLDKVLNLNEKSQEYNAQGYISHFEDVAGTYTLTDILDPVIQGQFIHDKKSISLGYSDSIYWFKITLKNNINASSNENPVTPEQGYIEVPPDDLIPDNQWSLDIAYPLLDRVEIYFKSESRPVTKVTLGDMKPFRERAILHSNFIVPFQLNPGEMGEIYIKVQTTSAVRLPLKIRTLDSTAEYYKNFQIGYGVYFGIIFASFLYNLFMYLFLKDRSYLYYIACIASFSFVVGSVIGFGQDHIWRSFPWLTDYIIVQSIAWYGIFALLFSQSFLHTKKNTPYLHKAMSFLIAFGGIVSIAGIFLPYSIVVRVVAAFTVLQTIFILTTGVITLLKGVKAAKYFVLAWTTVLVGVSLFALLANGLVPANFLTHYSAQFGSAMEVLLLSLALADRLRQVEQDKTRLEKEANDALKKANRDLSSALDQLRKSSRLKDEFLATLSHELRTPMNGVEAALELARHEKNPSKSLEHLDVAADSAKRMTHLVDTILEYSEIQADKTILSSDTTELATLLNAVSLPIKDNCITKGIKFNLTIDNNISANIKTDRRALALILNHLLDNAVKFTTEGEISLTASLVSKGNPHLSFVVSDSGIGVPGNAVEDIFRPFHQLDGSFKRGYGGLGIGLAICRELAIKMEGNLTVKNKENQGVEFTLTIPYEAVEAPTENSTLSSETTKQKTHNQTNMGKVLVVEDNMVNQKILVAILKKLGFETITANDGIQALSALEKEPAILIFMDCQMPNMDGFEATRHIRESSKPYHDLPIIAVTANAMSGDRARCLESGMNDYIKKPINKAIIEKKLLEWLASHNEAAAS